MDAICQAIRDHLEGEKQRVIAEIRHYPPPIPACDAQFNYLLEQRAAITRELGRLEAAQQAAPDAELVERIADFLESSLYVETTAKDAIHDLLRDKMGV